MKAFTQPTPACYDNETHEFFNLVDDEFEPVVHRVPLPEHCSGFSGEFMYRWSKDQTEIKAWLPEHGTMIVGAEDLAYLPQLVLTVYEIRARASLARRLRQRITGVMRRKRICSGKVWRVGKDGKRRMEPCAREADDSCYRNLCSKCANKRERAFDEFMKSL